MTLVLIVDDSPMDRALAAGLLERYPGFRTVKSEDGQAALQLARELKPDLIVADMQMPIMNGLEMIARLRLEAIEIPVILMTAAGSEDLAVEALRAGACSYVSKRRLAKRLVDTVQMVLAAVKVDDDERSLLMERMTSHSESFELGNRVEECLFLARHLQKTVARIWNLNQSSRLRIGLAVEEALLNALYHGNLEVNSALNDGSDNSFYEIAASRQKSLPYSARRIVVTSETTADETRFVIRDGGPGFDVKTLFDPTDTINFFRSSGRGGVLMHMFMDSITYNERGNQVILVKYR